MARAPGSPLAKKLRDNGLSLAVFSLFLGFAAAESVVGHAEHNDQSAEHGAAPISYGRYLTSGDFLESLSENWESEFLEMGVYVLFTSFLFQRGSSESKKPGESETVDRDPRRSKHRRNAPGPVRRGGFWLRIYEHSLSLAFFALFLVCFTLHATSGVRAYNEEQLEHGEAPVSVLRYVTGTRFWYQSLQNWQSEFLGLGAMIVLSIVLRQRGSPESKPVDAPHRMTGQEPA